MSLVGPFPHHPVMHHHDSHYSFHHPAGRCHEDAGGGGPPYFTGWLISHAAADLSPGTEYSLATSYSPEYPPPAGGGGNNNNNNSNNNSSSSPSGHHHHHYGGPGGGMVPVNGNPAVGMHHMHPHHHAHHGGGHGGPRPVKRRPTANRKERRRTQSINSAFAELRECIPNVPADTKLSKIKTLRLATSYISYLMDILDKEEQQLEGGSEAFKAEFKKTEAKEERRKREPGDVLKTTSSSGGDKKTKGRTGWPQHVWALELKQ